MLLAATLEGRAWASEEILGIASEEEIGRSGYSEGQELELVELVGPH